MTNDTGHLPDLLVGAIRMLSYLGYSLFAGTWVFFVLVWPSGAELRRLRVLATAGIAMLAVATITIPVVQLVLGGRLPGDVVGPASGSWLLLRLAVLAGAAFFGPDLAATAVLGWRRLVVAGLVAVVAFTLVVQSDAVTAPFVVVKVVATTGHVLATATWLGGLIVLAAVLIPSDRTDDLDQVIPRFSRLAVLSIVVLAVTGAVHALAAAGGVAALVTSWYGGVLAVKIVLFGGMLVLGNHARHYAEGVAFRTRFLATDRPGPRTLQLQTLGVAMGVEVGLAVGVLAVTALLVAVAPH